MIDLHCHSHFSDGTDAPAELALQAHAGGITALALTDHDTLEGLPEFLAMQPRVRTRLLAGIELSCRFMGMELHILGLFVDPSDPGFQSRIQGLQKRREARNHRMVERLQAMGIPISLQEVSDCATSRLVSRIHFARALVKRGLAGSRQDAFARLIGEGSPGHVPFDELKPSEACAWIKEAGGVPVLAHPGRSASRGFCWEEALTDLKTQGVEALEAYYSDYGPREERYFCDLAGRLGLAASGGSDYHGGLKPGLSLGVGRGGLRVPDELLEALEARRPGPG